jgi:quinol monooxygenase YgiN
MVFVTCRLLARTVHREELIRVSSELVERAKGDAGCLSIALFQNCADSNELVILGRWADPKTVDGHFATPHVQSFVERFPGLVEIRPSIEIHEVAATRKV